MTARAAGATFALACALLAAPARADASFDGKVFLDWSSDAGTSRCITRDRVITDVEGILGRPVFARRTESDRVLRVDVEETPPAKLTGQILLLTSSGVSLGRRELAVDAGDCEEAVSALTLALSIMADLPRTNEERALAAQKAAPPPPQPRPRWHGTLAFGPIGALDSNGDLAAGGTATLVLAPPRLLPFALTLVSSPRAGSTPAGAGYTLLSTTVAATVCAPTWSRGRFSWLSCLGPDLTLDVGWGAGFPDSRAGLSSTLGGLLQTQAAYSFAHSSSRWRVLFGLGATGTPQRVALSFVDHQGASNVFYRTPNFTVFSTIGVATDLF